MYSTVLQKKNGGDEMGLLQKKCDTLKLEAESKIQFVKNVMHNISGHIKRGVEHSSKRVYLPWIDNKLLIPPESDEYQIIGDSMEDGHGLTATTELIN